MGHSEDHDLVSMDPDKMHALIVELRAAHHTIAAFAAEFARPLSAQGVSVNTLHQAEHWTADQVAKLTERLHKLGEAEHTVPPMAGSGTDPQASSPPASSAPAGQGHQPKTSTNGASAGAGGAPAPASGYPPAAQPPAAVHPHAALDAKRVTHAAQHGQSLPERVWDD